MCCLPPQPIDEEEEEGGGRLSPQQTYGAPPTGSTACLVPIPSRRDTFSMTTSMYMLQWRSPIWRRAARVRSRQRVSIRATPTPTIPLSIATNEGIAPRRRPRSRSVLSDQTCYREMTTDGRQSKRGFPVRVWGTEVVRSNDTAKNKRGKQARSAARKRCALLCQCALAGEMGHCLRRRYIHVYRHNSQWGSRCYG